LQEFLVGLSKLASIILDGTDI